jgi:hypothetical protein
LFLVLLITDYYRAIPIENIEFQAKAEIGVREKVKPWKEEALLFQVRRQSLLDLVQQAVALVELCQNCRVAAERQHGGRGGGGSHDCAPGRIDGVELLTLLRHLHLGHVLIFNPYCLSTGTR